MYGNLWGNFGPSLFDDFGRLEGELDQLFGRWPAMTGIRSPRRGAFPPVNVGSTPGRVDVYVFAAGLDPASIDISVQQNLLVVSGERAVAASEGADYYRRERFEGQFRRAVALPDDADPDQVDARYRDGVLQVTVKRKEAARPRQIKVN